ncbi:hypothetical protein [Elizabethkingia meningoseptica]|uniref:hypothetical protein n=1 Tax=Elizabethkingia meningoseptica TaxID=238 RepID=UPI00162AB53A|nr:hypothetical protein [Elizabethkingia meningoseptica]
MELARFQKNNLFERLKNHYLDETFELEPSEIEKKNLYERIWALRYENKYSRLDIIGKLTKSIEKGGAGIPRSTAYRSYNYAMQLYGDLDAVDYAAEISFLKEALHEQYIMAKKDGDRKNAIAALKELKKLVPNIDEKNQIDPNKLQAHEYHLHMPRWVYKKMDAIMAEGSFDFNNLDVEDVEFKEDGTQSEDDGE